MKKPQKNFKRINVIARGGSTEDDGCSLSVFDLRDKEFSSAQARQRISKIRNMFILV